MLRKAHPTNDAGDGNAHRSAAHSLAVAFRARCLLLSVLLLLTVTQLWLAAECVLIPVDQAKRNAAIVFEGTVTNVAHLKGGERAATLSVHRVWKGPVPPEITVYFAPSIDGPSFEKGQRRIVFAGPQTDQTRRDVAADVPTRSVWVYPCSGSEAVEDKTMRQLGRARPPKAQ